VKTHIKQFNAEKHRNTLEIAKRKDAIKGLSKWDEFRVTREVVIREYCRVVKKVRGARKWLRMTQIRQVFIK
jgi:hypothetical protein